MKKLLLGYFTLILVACGAAPDKGSLGLDTTIPTDPVITSITYFFEGSSLTETSGLKVTKSINPDRGTNGCLSSQAYVKILGTFDAANTTVLTLTGAASQTTTMTGSSFQIDSCLNLGSLALILKASNTKGNADYSPAMLSLNVTSTVSTIGYGHPKYPNPGFSLKNGAVPSNVLGTGTTSLSNISVGDTGTQTIASAGNTGLTLQMGYVNVISQVNP